jgi:hypothetical protein
MKIYHLKENNGYNLAKRMASSAAIEKSQCGEEIENESVMAIHRSGINQ